MKTGKTEMLRKTAYLKDGFFYSLVKHMNKFFLVLLRVPIALIGLAIILGVGSDLSFLNLVMGIAILAFLYALWLGTEALNGPSHLAKDRILQSAKKMNPILLGAAVGILIYKLLNIVIGHA